jgi:predicted XRE-type DNA-binding protein
MRSAERNRVRTRASSGNVFRDLGFERQEAQNLLVRASLMNRIEKFVSSSGLSHRMCARRLGVSAPRLSDLLRGKIEKFSIDALVVMLGHVGLQVKLRFVRERGATAAESPIEFSS